MPLNLAVDCTAIPSIPWSKSLEYDTELTVFEDQTAQARRISTIEGSEIDFSFENQKDADFTSFRTFFANTQGVLFYWDDVRYGVTGIALRWTSSKIKMTAASVRTNSWKVSAKVVRS